MNMDLRTNLQKKAEVKLEGVGRKVGTVYKQALKKVPAIKNAILDMPTGAGTGTYHSLTPREMIAKVKKLKK